MRMAGFVVVSCVCGAAGSDPLVPAVGGGMFLFLSCVSVGVSGTNIPVVLVPVDDMF
jgi:hypothetical protein